MYLPEQWINDPVRRKEGGVPEKITFITKTKLALDVIDEVRGWGFQDRLVLTDSAYGDEYEFRQELRTRPLDYVVQVSRDLTAWTEDRYPYEPPMKRGGNIPRNHLYTKELPPARNLCQIAKDVSSQSRKKITWREGTKGPLSSRFARAMVWMANGLMQGKTMKEPPQELLIEWPERDIYGFD